MTTYTYRNAEDLAERAVDLTVGNWDNIIECSSEIRDDMLSAMVDVGYARCMIASDWPVTDEAFRDVVDSLQQYIESFI